MISTLTVRGDTTYHYRKELFLAQAAWVRTDDGLEVERESLILGSLYHSTSDKITEIDATILAMMQGLRGLPSKITHLTLQVNFTGDWVMRLIGGQFTVAPFYHDWIQEIRNELSNLTKLTKIILDRDRINSILNGPFTFNKGESI